MGTRYANGEVPITELVVFDSGWDRDGYYQHRLPRATYARHLELVRIAKARTGRTLRPTVGWSCDRPRYIQQIYRDRYGVGAAIVGKSSHGGTWAGPITGWATIDTAAIDYGNWGEVYGGNREAFFADCRSVGFWPGQITKAAFGAQEDWHVIDPRPYSAVPVFAGTGSSPFPEEDFMGALNDTEQRQIYDALVPDGAYYMPQAIVNVIRTEIAPAIASIIAGNILYPGAAYPAFPALANAIREGDTAVIEAAQQPDVDPTELANKLAPHLVPLLINNLGKLDDETVQRIANASANEEDRRERLRANLEVEGSVGQN